MEGRYIIQTSTGEVEISYYYTNGYIFRLEIDEGEKNIVRYATVPHGLI